MKKKKYYYDTMYHNFYDEDMAKAICLSYNPENKTAEELLQECVNNGDWKIVYLEL